VDARVVDDDEEEEPADPRPQTGLAGGDARLVVLGLLSGVEEGVDMMKAQVTSRELQGRRMESTKK
jgi:hypothetical protein